MTNAEMIAKIEEIQAQLVKNIEENGSTGAGIASAYLEYAKNCMKGDS